MEDPVDGAWYHDHSTQQELWARALTDRLTLPQDASILDLGCGDGRISHTLASRVPNGSVVGVDVSPNMIAFANKTYGETQNLSFETANAADFETNQTFSHIISLSTFHWIKDQQAVFSNLHKMMKGNGKLIVFAGSDHPHPVSDAFWQICQEENLQISLQFYGQSLDFYKEVLPKEGFLIDQLEIKQIPMHFPTKANLTEWLTGWIPIGTGLVGEEALSFSRKIATGIAEKGFSESNGEIRFSFPMVLLQARAS